MRATLSALALTITITLLAWCLQKGALPFTFDKKSIAPLLTAKQGEPVPFALADTDSSTNSSPYTWDFGDGTPPIAERNPTHVYEKSGTYTVTVTVSDESGVAKENIIEVAVVGNTAVDDCSLEERTRLSLRSRREQLVTGFTTSGTDSKDQDQVTTISTSAEINAQKTIGPPAGSNSAAATRTYNPSEVSRAQQILAMQVAKNPILKGTSIYIKDCPNNWQGCAFIESGIIWIDPDHIQPLEEIVIHECNHIIDWRQDGDIDYDDRHT